MKRTVLLAIGAQAVIVGLVAAPSLAVRLTGTEYRLRVQPVDPIDPFRGAYVDLGYVGFEGGAHDAEGRAFVVLRRDGDAWIGDGIVTRRPEGGPYVTCRTGRFSRPKCGIESWFVSQERAKRAERELVGGAIAVVRVSGSGRAVLVRVED